MQKQERWHGNYHTRIVLSYGWQLYCNESCGLATTVPSQSTLHPILTSGSPFEVCPSSDTTLCARQRSQPVQTC